MFVEWGVDVVVVVLVEIVLLGYVLYYCCFDVVVGWYVGDVVVE